MRVHLKGYGTPIPQEAMPGAGFGDMAPFGIFLTDGVPFLKADYAAFGFTHYEVFCIGGAGGRGGKAMSSYGGAGGGGGLHRVSGLLADLPDSCPVVVGQAGADGRDRHGTRHINALREFYNGYYYSYHNIVHETTPQYPYIDEQGNAIPPYVKFYWGHNMPPGESTNSYIYLPNVLGLAEHLVPPNNPYVESEDGQDGGTSSFNGVTCRASGGKGGVKAPAYKEVPPLPWGIWEPDMWRVPGGTGGEGGSGGRSEAGGGALGSETELNGNDGTWDGSVGKGGGGGRGGTYTYTTDYRELWKRLNEYLVEASSGGRGSYSFADTSMHGPREVRSRAVDYWDRPQEIIVPGSGGGAKVDPASVWGSRSPGANPNGCVYIRLRKID